MLAITQLPAEVLQLIFSLIVQRDKLECMTVCRQWHNILIDHSLFRAVSLYNQQQLDQFIERVKREPFLGKKVERITVQFKLKPNYDEEVFIKLFPHIRHFAIVNTEGTSRNSKSMALQQSHPWSESIESVVDFDSGFITKTFIHSGTCQNLTHLTVKGNTNTHASTLIKALVNAPSLKELQLLSYKIDFKATELLDETAPVLTSLSLKDICLFSDDVPPNIKPATSITKFQFSYINDDEFDERNPHFEYISRKYTQLEELTLNLEWFDDFDEDDDAWDQNRLIMVKYLETLGPRLKLLELQRIDAGYDYAESFEWDLLDDFECQIETLRFDCLANSSSPELLSSTTQVQHIRSLTIKLAVKNNRNEADDLFPNFKRIVFYNFYISYEWLKSFTVLRELVIDFPHPEDKRTTQFVCLTELLDGLSEVRLESLELRYAFLKFDNSSRIYAYPSLKSLTLYRNRFEIGTDIFISQSFPNLKYLTLISCFEEGVTFALPGLNLSYLKISNVLENETLKALVITLDNNQQRLYTASKIPFSVRHDADNIEKNLATYPSTSSEIYTGSMGVPFLTVVCKSIYDISLVNGDL